MDYQYGLSAWVYRILRTADAEFSRFLHDTGYQDGNKAFKFFTISELDLGAIRVWKDRKLFELKGDTFSFRIGFLIDRAYTEFVKGLFQRREGFIGDRFNGLDFEVQGVEALPAPVFGRTVRYRTLSPVFLSAKRPDGSVQHLHPGEHADVYAEHFLNNLREKRKVLRLHGEGGDISDREESWVFCLIQAERVRLVKVKPMEATATKKRACHMEFELTAPEDVHALAYDAGFGSENSWGCGMAEVVDISR
ncbi:CRISPR-associated endoribonuclease Cas6 [Fulvitalea axinellae]